IEEVAVRSLTSSWGVKVGLGVEVNTGKTGWPLAAPWMSPRNDFASPPSSAPAFAAATSVCLRLASGSGAGVSLIFPIHGVVGGLCVAGATADAWLPMAKNA